MEEKIYDRQVTKQSLSMRVIDEKQIGRHFSFAQLQELFVYTPPPPPPDTPTSNPYNVPESDMIFSNILKKLHPKSIVGYHTHDSLLEHINNEELSEEEQKLAWDNYNTQREMESRAYNIDLQNRAILSESGLTIAQGNIAGPSGVQVNAALAAWLNKGQQFGMGMGPPGMGVQGSGGMGMNLPGPSGMGVIRPTMPTMSHPGLPSGITTLRGPAGNNLPQFNGAASKWALISNNLQTVLDTAQQVKSLLMLRNKLIEVCRDTPNAAAKERYIKTYALLDKKQKDLNGMLPQISTLLRDMVYRSTLPLPNQNKFDMFRDKLLEELRRVQELNKVQAPNPNNV